MLDATYQNAEGGRCVWIIVGRDSGSGHNLWRDNNGSDAT